MSSILSRCRLSISKRGYHSRAPTAIKRVMFYSSLHFVALSFRAEVITAVSSSIYLNINFKVKQRVMFYSSLQAAVSSSIYLNINFKVKQVVCVEAIYRGRDVVAVLPTGYGKSLIFHLLPSLFLDKIKCESRVRHLL